MRTMTRATQRSSTGRRLTLAPLCVSLLLGCGRGSTPAPASSAAPVTDSVQVAYGTQPKDKITGAVATVPEGALAIRPLRIETLLRGRVPGLQVVQGPRGPTFRIRSTGTMLQDQEPLIIVDQIMIPSDQLETALAGLLPGQLRSVTVLKDVASTSVYGTRGAGGVIVIMTKK